MWTLFRYRYRDAGNYQAVGAVALAGQISEADRVRVQQRFDSEECFIAEQIGLPALYAQLYHWSNGPTSDDHCWHEFDRFEKVVSFPAGMTCVGTAREFVRRVLSVRAWQCELSPHYMLSASDLRAKHVR